MSKAGNLAARIGRATAAPPGNGAIADPPRPPAPAAPQPPGSARQRGMVRLTFDLDPELHRTLRLFALDERTDASKVIRAFVQLLDDPAVRRAVLEVLRGA